MTSALKRAMLVPPRARCPYGRGDHHEGLSVGGGPFALGAEPNIGQNRYLSTNGNCGNFSLTIFR
jgi:hypothetical protein